MTTTTFYTTGSSDDAWQTGTTVTVNSDGSNTNTRIDGSRYVGFRFPNITKTTADAIYRVRLRFPLLANYTGTGTLNAALYGQATDNAAVFTTASSNISSRTLTTARIEATSMPADDSWETEGVDVTAIFMETLRRSGWASGNAMAFIFSGWGSAGNYIQPYHYDFTSGAYKAELIVETLDGTSYANPSANASVTTGGTAWTSPTNAYSENASGAGLSSGSGGWQSDRLHLSGFGFSIPTNAKINGIAVRLKKNSSGTGGNPGAGDTIVQLSDGTTLTGANYEDFTYKPWPVSGYTWQYYGNPDDLWGRNWTPADINDSDFGIAIEVGGIGSSGTAALDVAQIQVFYDNDEPGYYDVEQAFLSTATSASNGGGNPASGSGNFGVLHKINNNTGASVDLARLTYRGRAGWATNIGGDPKTGEGGYTIDNTGNPLVMTIYGSQSNANNQTSPLATKTLAIKGRMEENYDFYLDSPITWGDDADLWIRFSFPYTLNDAGAHPLQFYWTGTTTASQDTANQTVYLYSSSSTSPTSNTTSMFYMAYSEVPGVPDESAFPIGDSEVEAEGYLVQFGEDNEMVGGSEMEAEGYLNAFGEAEIIGDSKMYADRITAIGGSEMDVDGAVNPLAITKSYMYKIYDPDWNFLGVWNDVVSEFGYSQEINSAGSAIDVTLARNSDSASAVYDVLADDSGDPIITDDSNEIAAEVDTVAAIGAGTTVDLNLNVRVYEFSSNTLDVEGDLVFTGYISKYTSQYGTTENTVVSIFSYGADLDNWVLEDSGQTRVQYFSEEPSDILKDVLDKFTANDGLIDYDGTSITDVSTAIGGPWNTSYTFNTNTGLEAVKKCLELAPTDWFFYTDLATNLLHFHPRPTTPDHLFYLGKHIHTLSLEKYMEDLTNLVYFQGGQNGTRTESETIFLDNFTDSNSTLLGAHTPDTADESWFKHVLSVAANDYTINNNRIYPSTASGEDIYIVTNEASTADYSVFCTYYQYSYTGDFGVIGRVTEDALTFYLARIQPGSNQTQLYRCIAGTYTLVGSAAYSNPGNGVTKTLELRMAGNNIKVFIDGSQVINVDDSTTPGGKSFGVRAAGAVTTSTGLHMDSFWVTEEKEYGVNLFKKYTDSASITAYRRGLQRISDNRVLIEDSADIISEGEIDRLKEPRYRSNITISGSTYDINSIKLGQLVGFRNFGNFVDTVTMQIVRIDYKPDSITLGLDTLLPSVPKRLEDIKRNLNQEQALNNPDAPSV